MKKVLVILAVAAMFASCSKSDKCKCKVEVGNITAKDQIVSRPEDMKCSEIKVQDLKGQIVEIDFSKIGKVTCVEYKD